MKQKLLLFLCVHTVLTAQQPPQIPPSYQQPSKPMPTQQPYSTPMQPYPAYFVPAQQPPIQIFIPTTANAQSAATDASQLAMSSESAAASESVQSTVVDLTNNLVAYLKSINTNSLVSSWQQKINNVTETWSTMVQTAGQDAAQRARGFGAQLYHLFADNKYKLIAAGAAGGFGYLWYTVFAANRYCARTELWSNWKQEITMEQLLAIPQQELSRQLIEAIQRRYATAQEPDDFFSPLVQFSQDVQKEMSTLKRYEKLYYIVDRPYIRRLFPIKENKQQRVRTQIERLVYLNNLFCSWVANHKSEKFCADVTISCAPENTEQANTPTTPAPTR